MKQLKRAFTLIELIIVIAVIAILAAVIVPTYAYVESRERQTNDESNVSLVNEALSSYATTYLGGVAPANYRELMSAIGGAGYSPASNPYLISLTLETSGCYLLWFPGTTSIVLITPDSGYTVTVYDDTLGNAAVGNAVQVTNESDGTISYAVRLCYYGNDAETAAANFYQLYYQAIDDETVTISDWVKSDEYSSALGTLQLYDSNWANAIDKWLSAQ